MKNDLASIFELSDDLDTKSTALLLNAIAAHSLESFDYIKFKRSIGAMLQMQMDEKTALKSTLATAATMGVTQDKLIQTVKHYRKVLDDEKRLFDQALTNQMEKRVASRVQEAEYIKKKIEEYDQKIKEFKAKMVEMKAKLDASGDDIEVEKSKIIETKDRFGQAYSAMIGTLEKDIQLISNQ